MSHVDEATRSRAPLAIREVGYINRELVGRRGEAVGEEGYILSSIRTITPNLQVPWRRAL